MEQNFHMGFTTPTVPGAGWSQPAGKGVDGKKPPAWVLQHIDRSCGAMRVSLLPWFALLTVAVHAAFDFGTGCTGGSGTFNVELAEGSTAMLGTIPAGKQDVKIFLSSDADLDVQLYDSEEVGRFAEGLAVIAWCDTSADPGCNIGKLGSDEGVARTTYRGVGVEYSGYGGVGGAAGREYIKLTGATTTALAMKAFAFNAGAATVEYSWERSHSDCCQGVSPCSGAFTVDVRKGEILNLGPIPAGMRDVHIALAAPSDIDIQLFDAESVSTPRRAADGGHAIIAYAECDAQEEPETCNAGALGNNNGGREHTTYKGLVYRYSGYNGVDGKPGHEWIQIEGITNTELLMKVFGYASGLAEVTYTYFEHMSAQSQVSTETLAAPRVNWQQASNRAAHHTDMFTGVSESTVLARRGGPLLEFALAGDRGTIFADSIRVEVLEWTAVAESEGADAMPEAKGWLSTNIVDRGVQGEMHTTLVRLRLAATCAVGNYTLRIHCGSNGLSATAYQLDAPIIILFNPYKGGKSGDGVYMSASYRREYVEAEEGLIWQGTSDQNTAHVWSFAQFEVQQLEVALRTSLRRLPLRARADPVQVARHISYAVGQDICYGKWGLGSYTSGKPAGGYRCDAAAGFKCVEPGEWTGTAALFALHRMVGQRPVQYCQCFVYAGVVTTIGRALGIPTRPVTTFQSAHDVEANRAIERYYEVNSQTGVFQPVPGPSHDSIWSFHVWNEMYMKRPDLFQAGVKGTVNGWQAVDATPQEMSASGALQGMAPDHNPAKLIYAMGPSSVAVAKRNEHPACAGSIDNLPGSVVTPLEKKFGCYDTQFVIAEVNADINMWVRDANGAGQGGGWNAYPEGCHASPEGCGFPTDPFGDEFGTIGQQISTKKRGSISAACRESDEEKRDCSADLDDITSRYKHAEPSSGTNPTSNKRRLATNAQYASNTENVASNVSFGSGLGMYPNLDGPLLNDLDALEDGPHSRVRLRVSLTDTSVFADGHDANVRALATCSLTALAIDYRGHPIFGVNESSFDASVAFRGFRNLSFGGNAVNCTFDVGPEHYRDRFANSLLGASEKAFALQFTFAVHMKWQRNASSASSPLAAIESLPPSVTRVFERRRVICTPLRRLRSGVICEDGRGRWREPELLSSNSCPPGSSRRRSRGKADNGECNAELNVAGCYDQGDCCRDSCMLRHGHFVALDSSGKSVPAHHCPTVSDDALGSACIDPQFARGGAYEFSRGRGTYLGAGTRDALEASGGVEAEEDDCAARISSLTLALNESQCNRSKGRCSSNCTQKLEQALCNATQSLLRECSGLEEIVLNATQGVCSLPRCREVVRSTNNAVLWHMNDTGVDKGLLPAQGWNTLHEQASAQMPRSTTAAASSTPSSTRVPSPMDVAVRATLRLGISASVSDFLHSSTMDVVSSAIAAHLNATAAVEHLRVRTISVIAVNNIERFNSVQLVDVLAEVQATVKEIDAGAMLLDSLASIGSSHRTAAHFSHGLAQSIALAGLPPITFFNLTGAVVVAVPGDGAETSTTAAATFGPKGGGDIGAGRSRNMFLVYAGAGVAVVLAAIVVAARHRMRAHQARGQMHARKANAHGTGGVNVREQDNPLTLSAGKGGDASIL